MTSPATVSCDRTLYSPTMWDRHKIPCIRQMHIYGQSERWISAYLCPSQRGGEDGGRGHLQAPRVRWGARRIPCCCSSPAPGAERGQTVASLPVTSYRAWMKIQEMLDMRSGCGLNPKGQQHQKKNPTQQQYSEWTKYKFIRRQGFSVQLWRFGLSRNLMTRLKNVMWCNNAYS